MGLHIEYCKEYGLSQQDLEEEEESQGEFGNNFSGCKLNVFTACTAYTRYVTFPVALF